MKEEQEEEDIEYLAKAAFRETYPKEYLDHLAKKESSVDLVELLWAGFVNGFAFNKKI